MNLRKIGVFSLLFALPAAPPLFAQSAQPTATAAAQRASGSTQKQTTQPGRPAFLNQIKIPALREFHPQQPKRIEFSNGMILFLQEDHELPLVSGSIIIRGGSTSEPAGKTGLVELYGNAWRTGGTVSKTGDDLDDLLEAHAAKVETSGGAESTALEFSCLTDDLGLVFDQTIDLLRNPAFREEKLALAQEELATAISRRNDDVGDITWRESTKLVYGPDNPYARQPEFSTIGAVTREDLVQWHKVHLYPNYMIVGIVGDFDSAAMETKLRGIFESLPKGPEYVAPKIGFRDPRPGVYFIEKDDINQSHINMVALGTEKNNPDYPALQVMNQIFSGGFGSRLFDNVRTKKGLAYAVGGGYGADYDHPGLFHVTTSTKSGTTAAAIDALNEEVEKLKTTPFTPAELSRAKDEVLNSFIFHYASKEQILDERMRLEFYGYPADFVERTHAALEKVTLADLARVANKYIDRSKLAVLVVGKSADFDRPLSSFGKVTPIDITIPGAPGDAPAGQQ